MAKRRMPKMGGMGGNMNQLMAQAQKMQQQLEKAQAETSEMKAEASAGGGVVTVKVNAQHQIEEISIKQEIVDPEDVEMLQDLVLAAVNEAMRKLDADVEAHMQSVPGLGGLGGMMGF